MKVSEVMTREIEWVDATATAADAARIMRSLNVGILPVMDHGRVIGIVTDRDLAVRVLADPTGARWTPILRAMSERCIVIGENQDLEEAIQLMCREGVSRLIAQDKDGNPVGVLSVADVAVHAASDKVAELYRVLGAKYRERHVRRAAHFAHDR